MIESLQNELKSMRAYCHELKTMVEKSEETSKLLATKMDKEQELKTQASRQGYKGDWHTHSFLIDSWFEARIDIVGKDKWYAKHEI